MTGPLDWLFWPKNCTKMEPLALVDDVIVTSHWRPVLTTFLIALSM